MNAEFKFIFDSIDDARIIFESINPEIKNRIPKTEVNISLSDEVFNLEIKSKDISSLRAAINSYLKWINIAYNVKKSV